MKLSKYGACYNVPTNEVNLCFPIALGQDTYKHLQSTFACKNLAIFDLINAKRYLMSSIIHNGRVIRYIINS